MKEIYRINQKRFIEGRIAIHDFKEAEFHYLEAELWLAQTLAQRTVAPGGEKNLSGSPRPAEALDLKKFGKAIPPQSSTRRRNPTPAQVDALRNQFEALFKDFLADRGTAESLLDLLQQQVEAELKLHSEEASRRTTSRKYYELTQRIEEVSKARYEAGSLSFRDYLASKFRRMEAQFRRGEFGLED